MLSNRMIRIFRLTATALAVVLPAGCAQITVNKAEDVWEAGKKRLVGMRETELKQCAGEPNSEVPTSTGSRLRYGYAEMYTSASAWCILNLDIADGSVRRFTVESQNKGGLTDGSFVCAAIVDECFGDGTLENAMRNSPGTVTSGRMEGNLSSRSAAYSTSGQQAHDAAVASSLSLASGLARNRTSNVASAAQEFASFSKQDRPSVTAQSVPQPQRMAANNLSSNTTREPAKVPSNAISMTTAPEASRSPTANSESAPKVSLDSQIISNGTFNLWRIKLTNSGSAAVRCFVSATYGYADPNSTGKILWDSATRTVTVPGRGSSNADYGMTDRNIQADSYRLMSCGPV